jgi:hypothetical protein
LTASALPPAHCWPATIAWVTRAGAAASTTTSATASSCARIASHGFQVCTDHVGWAKQQIVQDLPGHAVTMAPLNWAGDQSTGGSEVIHVTDEDGSVWQTRVIHVTDVDAIPMCRDAWCAEMASHQVSAQGTSHGFQVCTDHVGWAKQQIVQDLPGHAVTMAPLNWAAATVGSEVIQVTDEDLTGWQPGGATNDTYDDGDGW